MLYSDKPLDFHAMTVSVSPISILKVLEIGWNIKIFCNQLSPKYSAPFRHLYPFINSFVSPFVDLSRTTFCQEVSFVLVCTCLI